MKILKKFCNLHKNSKKLHKKFGDSFYHEYRIFRKYLKEKSKIKQKKELILFCKHMSVVWIKTYFDSIDNLHCRALSPTVRRVEVTADSFFLTFFARLRC